MVFLSLPLPFSVLFLVSLVDKSQATYQTFLREHVDPMRIIINPHFYCQEKMKAQGLTSPTCTEKNTFIHASNIQVKTICGVGGMHSSNTSSDSLASYIITTCHSSGGSPPDDCKYRGQGERRRIRVTCSRRVPVGIIKILTTWP
ncbi:PREDICTED: ribonuclease-like [Gekko japonicus]|uniref:Ribonuclease-like n=1 Tax=Gekko japonicus TaxID=146911 RepID=A0ABM1KII5_GEKJA|nr:PREDICTED: ribonuclease-like [Gekko japonicus]